MNKELERLKDSTPWRLWGCYLSDRQWGTVREDYSKDGSAWDYLSFDKSRSIAYRWGEEGIGGICDSEQLLCFSSAFWNYKDPFIKDRLFGVSGTQGNHGEDVKEMYYYLDNIPTHSYMKMLYKYPQRQFPYEDLVNKNKTRSKLDPEYELIDTGVFDNNEYFDIYIEYAKNSPKDICIKYTIKNHSENNVDLMLLPQIFFRNTWSWHEYSHTPELNFVDNHIEINHNKLDKYYLYAEKYDDVLFCNNNTNVNKVFNYDSKEYFKDGISDFVVHNSSTINLEQKGTKASYQIKLNFNPKEEKIIYLRLTDTQNNSPFKKVENIFQDKIQETNNYYDSILLDRAKTEEDKEIQKISLSGLLWTKQFYYYEVKEWLHGDERQPRPPEERKNGRNNDWEHLNNKDIISMPDKWEYPWYAAWDLAFHCIPLAMVDPEFAKNQLILMTKECYMHPNGQLPAYEWAFSDVNPPVHAWASWRIFQSERKRTGNPDFLFLEKIFHKLLLNFTWWVNRKDPQGRNLFQGGFLGLDNIGIFDRSAPLPTGGFINQSDGTSWMAMYALNMMRIAIELALRNPAYEDIAIKFFEHFLQIAEAMTNLSGEETGLWDETEGFYFDVLNLNNGTQIPLKIFSIVGLIPLFAVEVLDSETLEKLPNFNKRLNWILENRQDLANLVSRWYEPGVGEKRLLSLLRGSRMKKILKRMLDPEQFLSDYGIRALSKYHANHPFTFEINGNKSFVKYQPGESDSGFFGGNSNWRGPIWMPINFLILESLRRFHNYYGDDFKIEFPTGSNNYITIIQVALEISDRLTNIFRLDSNNQRAVYSQYKLLNENPEFNKHLLFFEYFHGDTGRGVGASHQTGWTALIAKIINSFSK